MKSYLLDTHILLWWLSDDKKLPKKISNLIEEAENDIILSSVTIWEIMIKKSLNKLTVPDNLEEVLDENNIQIISMTSEHAFYLEKLPLIHNDPFDRLLISQAIVDNLIFVTVDTIIPKYQVNCF